MRPPITGNELESGRLKATLGEMLLERELLEAKVGALEASRLSLLSPFIACPVRGSARHGALTSSITGRLHGSGWQP